MSPVPLLFLLLARAPPPRTSFLLLARALPSPRLLPPLGTHASFLLLAPVPPPLHLLPPPSTRATAALPYSSCHARRRPDLPCRTLLPGSCRRPDHISTSSGHRRAASPPAPTPRISSWWGFITTVPDHPRPFNATNPVRSLQQHPGSGYHHVVPTVMFDGAPRLSPAAGRPTYCTMEVATSSFCRSPPPASVGRAPSPDSRSRHVVHRRHHSLFIADNRGRSTTQRRDLAFPLPLYMYLCILFQFIYVSIISLISSVFPCYSCIVQWVFVFSSVHLLADCKSNYICFSMFFIQYEKICRCTTEFADCHVKQCQQATSSKGKRRARLTSVVKNNRTSVLKFPAH